MKKLRPIGNESLSNVTPKKVAASGFVIRPVRAHYSAFEVGGLSFLWHFIGAILSTRRKKKKLYKLIHDVTASELMPIKQT